MYRWYGWGTFVCQDCRGEKKSRESKRCRPCNHKSKEFSEIQRECQTKRYEDPEQRRKMKEVLSRPEVKKRRSTAQRNSAKWRTAVRSQGHREKQSKAMKRYLEDPEARRKMREAARRGWMKRKQAWKLD
jgi:hypothetical protein